MSTRPDPDGVIGRSLGARPPQRFEEGRDACTEQLARPYSAHSSADGISMSPQRLMPTHICFTGRPANCTRSARQFARSRDVSLHNHGNNRNVGRRCRPQDPETFGSRPWSGVFRAAI